MLNKQKNEHGQGQGVGTRPYKVVLIDHHHHHHYHRHGKDGDLKGDPLKQPTRHSRCTPSVQAKFQVALFVVIFLMFRKYSLLLDLFRRPEPYILDEYLICDRSDYRTDVCQMKGDVRIDGKSKSIYLLSKTKNGIAKEEKIRPYTRKWEEIVMSTIDEITLREIPALGNSSSSSSSSSSSMQYNCDVQHIVPAVVFSAGGHSSNLYHAFHDGFIPIFIAANRFHGEVVFVILDYQEWWVDRYKDIFRQLSRYDLVNFNTDTKVHCFPEASVGLKVHDELTIDSTIENTASLPAFQQMLHNAYGENPNDDEEEKKESGGDGRSAVEKIPSLIIISREGGSRCMLNEEAMAQMAREMGFQVTTLKPQNMWNIPPVYRQVHASDVMVGVHGAGLTHLLFLKPGSSLIQIIPLGLEWASLNYYGQPAMRLGMRYFDYHILPQESTLSQKYPEGHPVLDRVQDRSWAETKQLYLDGQNITVDLTRFHKVLLKSYKWATKPSLLSPSLPRHQI